MIGLSDTIFGLIVECTSETGQIQAAIPLHRDQDNVFPRNVSTTLIQPGSAFRLDSVTPAGGLWVDGELAGTEVFALRA
jgi:hypothetical protein